MSRRALLAVVVFALAVRVLYNGVALGDFVPSSDAHHYNAIATSVADGDGLSAPFPFPDAEPQATAFRPPLYPVVLGGLYAVFGSHIAVAQALNVVLGTIVVALATLLAARMAGRRAGLVTGLLLAVYPPLLANDGPPLSEPLSLCLLLLTVFLLLEGRVAWAGATVGLQVLTKPSAQGLALVLAAWVVWRLGWRRVVGFALPVVLIVTPWLLRNADVMGSPVVVTSNGFNLAALYSPPSLEAGSWLDPMNDPRFASLREAAMAAEDEVALDESFRRSAIEGLKRHPVALIEVAAENVMRALELRPAGNDGAERSDGRNLAVRYGSLWLTWTVLAVGAVGLASRRRAASLLMLMSAGYFTVVSLLFSPMAPRLRAPLDVVCCIGVGVALSRREASSETDGPEESVVIDLRDAAAGRLQPVPAPTDRLARLA